MIRPVHVLVAAAALPLLIAPSAAVPSARTGQSSSLMARSLRSRPPQSESGMPHALFDTSMFAIAPPEVREFQKHDLVQIVVRETSRTKSSQELEIEKDSAIDGRITAFPHLSLADLLDLQLRAGNSTDLPAVRIGLGKEFQGEGDYSREDDFTARLTAEIIEILPNDHLVLEARTHIKTDEEESTIMVTGVCRPDDVTASNTILSNQIHDLKIVKMNEGELKKTNEKGIITKFFDTLFAW